MTCFFRFGSVKHFDLRDFSTSFSLKVQAVYSGAGGVYQGKLLRHSRIQQASCRFQGQYVPRLFFASFYIFLRKKRIREGLFLMK